MACNSFDAKADNATVSLILSWQLNSNLLYFLLCCDSPVTHWCLSFSLHTSRQKSGLLLGRVTLKAPKPADSLGGLQIISL